MTIARLARLLLAGIATGCTTIPPAPFVSMSDLPNCFDSNYDLELGLFTIRNDIGDPVNQQCLLTVWPRGDIASASRLTAGRYRVYLANGGGGGAGGTMQAFHGRGGGGGGGGGAGSKETQAVVNLTEGAYKLTIGAGGPGGNACVMSRTELGDTDGSGGGPGWLGSPSSMIRVVTGELVIGTLGADRYARPTRGANERIAGRWDAHGGSGPGQASGGRGAVDETKAVAKADAAPGASRLASGRPGVGGAPGGDFVDDKRSGVGGGGGATSLGHGGAGSGETRLHKDTAPERGSLGSGGGGGEGDSSGCDPGARGGHGYIALRPI